MQQRVFYIVRQTAGTLFEVLFLVFLMVANVSGTQPDQVVESKESSAIIASAAGQIVLRDNPSRTVQIESLNSEFCQIIDLCEVALIIHQHYFVSIFQRSAYYVFNSSSAP